MPSYPKPCPKCGVMTAEEGFGVDRSKTGGRESYCKACDRRRGLAYDAEHRDQLYADRKAAREAAWQADLKELEKESRKRVAAQKKLHEAGVRRQESSYARSAYPI